MNKIKFTLFLLLLFFVYTQGLWDRTFPFLPQTQYIVDFFLLLFVSYKFRFSTEVPGAKLFIILLIILIVIGFTNNNSTIESILYFRYVFFFYLIYNQLYISSISFERWEKIWSFILLLILAQGIGALYNILVLGERVEGYVGLMSSLGGTTATAFPVLISSLVFLFYLFKDKPNNREWLMFCLILLSVFTVGYSSGKRGIYFIIPFFFILSIILSFSMLIKKGYFKKKILIFSLIGLLLLPLLTFGIQNSKGFNYILTGNEGVYETLSVALEYAEKYENATDDRGNTIGRSNTSETIFTKSLEDMSLLLHGKGFGAIKNESTQNELGYGYGIVGFTRDIISGGWIFMVFTVLLYFKVIRNNKSQFNNLTTVIRRLLMCVFIYIHFFYSADFTVSLKLSLILATLLALINSPYHYISLNFFLSKNRLN